MSRRRKSHHRDRDKERDREEERSSSSSAQQAVVLFRTSLHNTVFDVLRSRPGWRETDSDTDWDINWADTGMLYTPMVWD